MLETPLAKEILNVMCFRNMQSDTNINLFYVNPLCYGG